MAGMTLPENLASLRMELSECTTAATYATSLQVCCAGYLEWHSNMIDMLRCLILWVTLPSFSL